MGDYIDLDYFQSYTRTTYDETTTPTSTFVNTLIDEITNSNELKSPHGIRNAEKKFDCIAKLANTEKIISEAQSILGKKPQLVRAIFFDKNPVKY